MALDVAGEALALRDARHVDQVAFREEIAQGDRLAELILVGAVDPELADLREALGTLGQVLQLAGLRLGHALGRLAAELDRNVAVAVGRPEPCHGVRLDGHDADGHHRAVGLEHLRHADLAADESNTHRAHSVLGRMASRSFVSDLGERASVAR